MNRAWLDDIELPQLASLFGRCQRCSYVTVNTVLCNGCSNCGVAQGSNTLLHFSYDTHALLLLLSDYDSKYLPNDRYNAQPLAAVIFFCSLTEVLLHHFLVNLMDQLRIDRSIQARLLRDNLSARQRVDRLFPALVGQAWKDAVTLLCTKSNLYDYLETVDFYANLAVPARNRFLHEGDVWAISKNLAENCTIQGRRVVCFFIELHNHYVVKSIIETKD